MSKHNERWWERARELEQAAKELGRLPVPSDESISPALLAWARNQRRARRLTTRQVRALERIPGWSWAPREDQWEDRLDEVARFFAAHERAPRVRATDEREASLGLWLARQRRAADTRAMPYARLTLWGEFASQFETDDHDC